MTKANSLLVDRLQLQMQRKNINARELAERAGLGRSFVYDVLSGKSSNPTTQKLSALADVLGCSMLYLMGESDTPDKKEAASMPGDVVSIASLITEPAGGGGTLVTEGEEEESYFFRRAWIREKLNAEPTDLRIVFVADDLMEPSLSKGDMVLINLKDREPNPAGMFVIFNGSTLLVRELQYAETLSEKKLMAFIKDSTNTLREVMVKDIQIVGRVVWLAREL